MEEQIEETVMEWSEEPPTEKVLKKDFVATLPDGIALSVDKITKQTMTAKSGAKYTQYTLIGSDAYDTFRVSYLMRNNLKWSNTARTPKNVKVTAIKQGKYFEWVIVPI